MFPSETPFINGRSGLLAERCFNDQAIAKLKRSAEVGDLPDEAELAVNFWMERDVVNGHEEAADSGCGRRSQMR